MATVDRDGVTIHYEATGPVDGPAIVMTHGFAATHETWQGTAAALSTTHRCVHWDLRGHGASTSPDDPDQYSPELALDDIEALLDAESITRAVLMGHSLGGYLSLRFRHRAPDRAAALILVGTGPGYRNDDARAGWNDMCESFAAGFEANGLDSLAQSPETRAATHAGPTGLVHAARGILTQHDALVLEHLASIDVPTLIVVGSNDRPFLASSEYMAKKIRGARHVVIDGAGHAPMLTHPDVFNGVVADFLDETRSR